LAVPKRFKFKSLKKTFIQINNNSSYIKLMKNKSFFDECHYYIKNNNKNKLNKKVVILIKVFLNSFSNYIINYSYQY